MASAACPWAPSILGVGLKGPTRQLQGDWRRCSDRVSVGIAPSRDRISRNWRAVPRPMSGSGRNVALALARLAAKLAPVGFEGRARTEVRDWTTSAVYHLFTASLKSRTPTERPACALRTRTVGRVCGPSLPRRHRSLQTIGRSRHRHSGSANTRALGIPEILPQHPRASVN